jgi:hypothetical protein
MDALYTNGHLNSILLYNMLFGEKYYNPIMKYLSTSELVKEEEQEKYHHSQIGPFSKNGSIFKLIEPSRA